MDDSMQRYRQRNREYNYWQSVDGRTSSGRSALTRRDEQYPTNL